MSDRRTELVEASEKIVSTFNQMNIDKAVKPLVMIGFTKIQSVGVTKVIMLIG